MTDCGHPRGGQWVPGLDLFDIDRLIWKGTPWQNQTTHTWRYQGVKAIEWRGIEKSGYVLLKNCQFSINNNWFWFNMKNWTFTLSRMDNSLDYVISEVDGIKMEENITITLSMLIDLEKNGGWLQLPSTSSPYQIDQYHIISWYLSGGTYIYLFVTAF